MHQKLAHLNKGVKPHTEATIVIEGFDGNLLKDIKDEAYLRLSFTLKSATNWAPAGHRVSFGEILIIKPLSISKLRAAAVNSSKPNIQRVSRSQLRISSPSGGSTWDINLRTGLLQSWQRKKGVELLSEPISMDFYRALTDNDRGGHGRNWIDRRLHQTSHHVQQIKWQEVEDGLNVEVTGRIAPPVLCWSVDVLFTYHFRADTLHMHVHGKPNGLLLPETFARIGITTSLHGVDKVKWWGRGPGETYCDKKLSQPVGSYEATVDELWVDYEFPQDGGNRTDVRRVEFLSSEGRILRAQFGDQDGASFSAMHYSTKDIDDSKHPYELHKKKREATVVRLDWAHHGQGGGSCGPWTLPEYQLKTDKEFDFELLLD